MELIDHIAQALTNVQRAEISHHTTEFARPADAQAARRIWLGIRPLGGAQGISGETYWPLLRLHNACRYRLSEFGEALKAAIARNTADPHASR